jgi:hypothetical protein
MRKISIQNILLKKAWFNGISLVVQYKRDTIEHCISNAFNNEYMLKYKQIIRMTDVVSGIRDEMVTSIQLMAWIELRKVTNIRNIDGDGMEKLYTERRLGMHSNVTNDIISQVKA